MSVNQTTVTGTPFPDRDPDVQRTSFSLDVMGRYICSTYQEATRNPDYDVVVIGSGMFGAYCAAKLFRDTHATSNEAENERKSLRILVLEAGPFLVPEHVQNLPSLGSGNPFRPDENKPNTFEARDKPVELVWGTGWRGNVFFPGTAYCVGGKSLYWGGWCPRLRDSDLQQWPENVRNYLLSPPEFPSSFPNRLSSPDQNSVYEEVEFEIGVKPPDDFVFDPQLGPTEIPGAIGLNEAFGARLKEALGRLRASNKTLLQDPEPPPIAVQTQSFVSGVFSPDKFSSLSMLISALREGKGEGNSEEERDRKTNLFLVPHAHVSRLVVPKTQRDGAQLDGYGITGIDLVVDGQKQHLAISPRCTVVLALGAIESTRLALESFPTAPSREGDELMGRNLMAHSRFDFDFDIDRKKFADWVKQKQNKDLRSELQTAAFHLQADTPDGRFHLQVYGTGEENVGREGLLYRMIPDAEVARRLAQSQTKDTLRFVFRACGEIRGDRAAKLYQPGTNWIDLDDHDRDQIFDHARAYVHYESQTNSPMFKRMRAECVALAKEMGGILAEGAEDGSRYPQSRVSG